MSKPRQRAEAGIGLEAESADEGTRQDAASTPERPRQDQRPTCPEHAQQMVAYNTNPMFTYYRCPVKGCKKTDKKVRPVGPLANRYGNGKSGGQPEVPETE